MKRAARNGYQISMTPRDYVWGSNGVVANYGLQLLVANVFKPNPAYVNAALDNLHIHLSGISYGKAGELSHLNLRESDLNYTELLQALSYEPHILPAALEATFLVGLAIVYVELVLGELVPKALALRYSESVALLVSWPLSVMARASRFLVVLLTASTRAVLALFGVRDAGPRTFVSEEEIMHMVREGRQQGVQGDGHGARGVPPWSGRRCLVWIRRESKI